MKPRALDHGKNRNRFAERMREPRLKNGYHTESLPKDRARCNGMSLIEPGQRECSFDMLFLISEMLDVNTDYLLRKSDH